MQSFFNYLLFSFAKQNGVELSMNLFEFQFAGETFEASADRVLLHPQSNTMFVADCHFGKASHFRRNNLPIPQKAAVADFQNLHLCLEKYRPDHCIFLGDLFHSASNHEWIWLKQLLKMQSQSRFTLVEGNHDILEFSDYENAGLPVVESLLFCDKIQLSHEPLDNITEFNICGHIHPGFSIHGKGRQQISLPCFFLTHTQLIMPSFGRLTGFVPMNKKISGGKAICIAGEKLYCAENS